MGKRSKTKNVSPYPKASEVASSKSHGMEVDSVPISKLWEFNLTMNAAGQEAFSYEIALNVIAAMVTVVMLVQLRLSIASLRSPLEVDAMPSFKYYKSRILNGPPGVYTGILIGLYYSLHYETCDDLEVLIGWYKDSFNRFSKHIEKCSQANHVDFVRGKISRVIGLMHSCPTTNLKLIGLDKINKLDLEKLDIDAVIELCGVKDKLHSTVDKGDVITYIRKLTLTTAGGFDRGSITFEETPCKSLIESEIFTSELLIRNESISEAISKASGDSEFSESVIKEYLTDTQFLRYKLALSSGQTQFVKSYLDIVRKSVRNSAASEEVPPEMEEKGDTPPPSTTSKRSRR